MTAGVSMRTPGGVLSISQVPVSAGVSSVLPERSSISCPLANDSVMVASRLARVPPDAFTSHALASPLTAVTVSDAVVPAIEKSPDVTFRTSSSKVTRQVTSSALVGEPDGVWCAIELSIGFVVSACAPAAPSESPADSSKAARTGRGRETAACLRAAGFMCAVLARGGGGWVGCMLAGCMARGLVCLRQGGPSVAPECAAGRNGKTGRTQAIRDRSCSARFTGFDLSGHTYRSEVHDRAQRVRNGRCTPQESAFGHRATGG